MVRRRVVAGAVCLIACVSVAGCSWRIDTAPAAHRAPSAVTVMRDSVAAAEAEVAAVAGTSTDPLAVAEADAAPARLAALGGVSPTSSPRPTTDFESAVSAAITAASACVDGAGDDPLGGLCASIALSHEVIGAAASLPSPESLSYSAAPTALPGADTEVTGDRLAWLALEHDRLRALYEVVAARSDPDARRVALARSSQERARVEELLALQGVKDLTEPQYDVPTDPDAVRQAQMALGDAYAALLVSAAPQDRDWLFNSAVVAYNGAIAAGMTPDQVPALPGAVQPSPSPRAS